MIKKNLLLMSLSTFNFKGERAWKLRAKNEPNTDFGDYIYQMEPLLIYLGKKLAEAGEKLDCVVALATKETNDKQMLPNGKGEFSPRTFLESQYPDIEFIFIEIDKNSVSKGIVDGFKKTNEMIGEYNIWVDTHGSLREISAIMQGILSLLETVKNVSPKRVFSCETNNSDQTCTIIPADEGYEINNFVSGMNEFLYSGKADQLLGYFENKKDKEVAELIRDISESILLCDMDRFDDSCDRLSDWLKTRKDDGGYLDLFAETIRNDYGILLNKEKGIVSKIDWCLKKDYIQQALTIIESKMPDRIFDKILKCTNLKETAVIIDHKGNPTNDITKDNIQTIVKKAKKKWEPLSNYLVYQYIYESLVDRDDDESIVFPDIIGIKEDSWEKDKLDESFLVKCSNKRGYELYVSIRVEYRLNEDTIPVFVKFMRAQLALKNQRNSAAHGVNGKSRVGIADIRKAIEYYVSLAEKLGIR